MKPWYERRDEDEEGYIDPTIAKHGCFCTFILYFISMFTIGLILAALAGDI